MLGVLLTAAAFAFRPTDGTDAGVADRGVVEVQATPGELATSGAVVAGPAVSAAVGLGRSWEVGLSSDFAGLGAAVKHTLASGPGGAGVAVEVAGTVAASPVLTPMLAVTIPAGALRVHLDGGGSVDAAGAIRGVAIAILEGPELGPVVPVGELAASEGTGPLATTALAGLVATAGPIAFDAAVALVGEGSERTGLVRGGLTATFGPIGRRPVVVAESEPEPPPSGPEGGR